MKSEGRRGREEGEGGETIFNDFKFCRFFTEFEGGVRRLRGVTPGEGGRGLERRRKKKGKRNRRRKKKEKKRKRKKTIHK